MRTKVLIVLVLSSIVFSLAIPTVAAEGDFPYALTTEDTPVGFEFASTTFESEYMITQTWKTPSDAIGTTVLTVINYNSTTNAESMFDAFSLYSPETVTVEGADEAINVTILSLSTIYARNGQYAANILSLSSDSTDIITLMESQMALHNAGGGGGAPGFTLYISFLAIGVVTVLLKKRK